MLERFGQAFALPHSIVRKERVSMISSSEAISSLNIAMAENNIPVSFSQLSGKPCSVYPNQCRTFGKLLATLISNPTTNKIVLGMLQSGKTGTSILTHLIPPIMEMLYGEKYVVVDLLTNRLGHKRQTEKELNAFENAFLDVKIEHNNKSIVLKEFMDKLQQELRCNKLMFARTNNRKSIKQVHDFCNFAKEQGYNIIFNVDEIHWGMEQDGVFERYIKSCLDDIADASKKDVFIGFSATPFQYTSLGAIDIIPQYLGEDYHGPNWFAGEIHDPTAKTTQQKVIPLESVMGELGEVVPNAFHYVNIFDELKDRITVADNILDYRTKVVQVVRKFILQTLQGYTRTGMVVRWVNDNQCTREFISKLKLDDLTVIPYFGENAHHDVKETIDRFVGDTDQNYVIFVTGAARMADAFPSDVKFFADFTVESSTLASLLQGLYGRSCGYNKSSTVFLSNGNYEAIMEYIRTKGKYVKHPHESVVVEKKKRGRKPMCWIFNSDSSDALVQHIFQRLQTEIVDVWLNHSTSNLRKASKTKGKNSRRVKLFDILDSKVLDYLEGYVTRNNPRYRIKLLRPGQYDATNNTYNVVSGLCEIGFRTSSGGNRSANPRYPQLFVKYQNNRWVVESLQLRLTRPLEENPSAYALPSVRKWNDRVIGGVPVNLMSENEREKAKEMKSFQIKVFRSKLERYA